MGTYEELMKTGKEFSQLLARQESKSADEQDSEVSFAKPYTLSSNKYN